MRNHIRCLLLVFIFLALLLSGCAIGSLAVVYSVPVVASDLGNKYSPEQKDMKDGLFLETTTNVGANWNNVTVTESELYPSNRVKYDSAQRQGIELGIQTEKGFQYSIYYSESDYNVKVDNNHDQVHEKIIILHHGYVSYDEYCGVNPFVRAGYGGVGQKFDKTEFMQGSITPETNNIIAGTVLDVTCGVKKSMLNNNLNLAMALQYLRLSLYHEDTANEPLSHYSYGSTQQFNLLFSLSYVF